VGVVGAGLLAAAGVASAQENLDAGKSGAQLYQSNCAICHKSAQALDKSGGGLFGLESFLREHYTSSRESAAAISAYLNTVGGGPAQAHPVRKKAGKKKEAKPETKPDAKDGKPAEAKPEEEKPDEKKPDGKSGDKPSENKPGKKEGGKAARLAGVPLRG
jgi:cytochrome c